MRECDAMRMHMFAYLSLVICLERGGVRRTMSRDGLWLEIVQLAILLVSSTHRRATVCDGARDAHPWRVRETRTHRSRARDSRVAAVNVRNVCHHCDMRHVTCAM